MTLREKIKKLVVASWNWLVRVVIRLYKPVALLLILVSTWYGFLKLVKAPPLDTTPVLIMIWVTAGILILSLFPTILNRIKKIKIGDIEIELQEAVIASVSQDYIALEDAQRAFDTDNKGGTKDLQTLLARVMQFPKKPIVLIVNVRDKISKAFLFVYLFLLDLFSDCESVFVMFIYAPQTPNALSKIDKDDVLGVISGKSVLQLYYERFKGLNELWGQIAYGSKSSAFETLRSVRVPSSSWIRSFSNFVKSTTDNASKDKRDYDWRLLSIDDVKGWIWDSLSKRFVNFKIQEADLDIIQEALSEGDEVVIVVNDKKVKSLVFLNTLARNISKKFLLESKRDK